MLASTCTTHTNKCKHTLCGMCMFSSTDPFFLVSMVEKNIKCSHDVVLQVCLIWYKLFLLMSIKDCIIISDITSYRCHFIAKDAVINGFSYPCTHLLTNPVTQTPVVKIQLALFPLLVVEHQRLIIMNSDTSYWCHFIATSSEVCCIMSSSSKHGTFSTCDCHIPTVLTGLDNNCID